MLSKIPLTLRGTNILRTAQMKSDLNKKTKWETCVKMTHHTLTIMAAITSCIEQEKT